MCISVDMLTRAALKRRLAAERLSNSSVSDASNETVGPKLRSSDEQIENAHSSDTVSELVAANDSTPPQDADPSIRIRQARNEEHGNVLIASSTSIPLDNSNPNVESGELQEDDRASLPFGVTSGSVVSKIEAMMETILDQLLQAQDMSISLVSRSSTGPRRNSNRLQPVRFTGRSNVEATKFARLLLILQLSHSAIASGIILTKRNVYYQNQELFKSQQIVDQLVDDIAVMLTVNRDDLNIVASAKSLVVGPMLLRFHDGSCLDVTLCDEGTLLPTTKAISSIDVGTSRWLLVIEKDATFRSLASAKFWQRSLAGPGVLVTAKGYPDLSARTFLNLVQSTYPSLPIFILTDYDPDGVNIFSCYRFGSDALSHETQANNLRATWLGVKTGQVLERQSEILRHGALQTGSNSFTNCLDSVLPLSSRDRKLAYHTISRARERNDDDKESTREIQLMLMLNAKAEIQCLDEAGNLEHWLDREILSHLLYD